MRVLAYVTAFCDKSALSNCIKSIQSQSFPIYQILIVDNSPLPLNLPCHEDKLSKENVMTVVHCPENIGVGGGVVLALEQAIGTHCDFLWLLDQDSQPSNDCLEKLIKVFGIYSQNTSKPVGIVAPSIFDEVMQKEIGCSLFNGYSFQEIIPDWSQDSYCECDAPIASGSLILVEAAKSIERPQSELFIDGVDLDYGLKMRKGGFYNVVTSSAVLKHHLGTPLAVVYGGNKYFIHNYSVERSYYYYRNHTYLELRYSQFLYKILASIHRLKVALKDITLTILYRDRKFARIYACILGTLHGFQGKLGKKSRL